MTRLNLGVAWFLLRYYGHRAFMLALPWLVAFCILMTVAS